MTIRFSHTQPQSLTVLVPPSDVGGMSLPAPQNESVPGDTQHRGCTFCSMHGHIAKSSQGSCIHYILSSVEFGNAETSSRGIFHVEVGILNSVLDPQIEQREIRVLRG